MSDIFIYPYNAKSKSVKALAMGLKKAEIPVRIIALENSKFVPSSKKTVINWGSANDTIKSYAERAKVLNEPSAVDLCGNKLNFFRTVEGSVNIPPFTTSVEEASQWVAEGRTVVGRTPRGTRGEGIFFSDVEDDARGWNQSKLFTQYIPKITEFRVHIIGGNIVDVQEKRLRKEDERGNPVDPDLINWRVRNLGNGFIFARENIAVPRDVLVQAETAFKNVKGISFGAFDVIYNKKRDKAYVLECNTAPALEGTTIDTYIEGFKKIL